MLTKKINLLLYLAKVDDHFAESEKSLLQTILRENGLELSYLQEHRQEIVDLEEIKNLPGKSELLFWALKLIHADHRLHPAEIFYCKVIAYQLGFKPEVIGFFSANPLQSLEEFEQGTQPYQILSS
jgi:hypothetical protein